MKDDRGRAAEIRARYAAIVESSNDAIIVKNLDGVISAWNAAAQRMFGYAEHEVIGRPITTVNQRLIEAHEEERTRSLPGNRRPGRRYSGAVPRPSPRATRGPGTGKGRGRVVQPAWCQD